MLLYVQEELPIYIVNYYEKWVPTSWTYSMNICTHLHCALCLLKVVRLFKIFFLKIFFKSK